MGKLHPAISKLLEREAVRQRAENERNRKNEEEWAKEMKGRKKMLRHLRHAKPRHYINWLEEFFAQGGEATHYYDYPMPNDVYLAKRSFDAYPLYGAAAISIILPHGMEVRGELGHTKVFGTKGRAARDGFVPVWADTLLEEASQ